MANKHIFAKVLGAEMTGKKTDRHGEWYHFHENAWSWNDKMGKLIVTASGTIFAKMLGVGMTKGMGQTLGIKRLFVQL